MSSRILVVEDAEDQRKILQRTLAEYKVTSVASAEEASSLLQNEFYDLILIDINLPQRNGYSLLNEIQQHSAKRATPIFCVSGRSDVADKVTAFSLGADDYITKPFDPLELQARISAKLKKAVPVDSQVFVVGELQIDSGRHRVTKVLDGHPSEEVDLTPTEFKLLACLARRPEQVYTRDQLLVAAWGEDARVLDRVIDTHICLLRKKLGSLSHYVKSVSRVGYKLMPKKISKKAG